MAAKYKPYLHTALIWVLALLAPCSAKPVLAQNEVPATIVFVQKPSEEIARINNFWLSNPIIKAVTSPDTAWRTDTLKGVGTVQSTTAAKGYLVVCTSTAQATAAARKLLSEHAETIFNHQKNTCFALESRHFKQQ